MDEVPVHRICSSCRTEKPLEDFGRRKHGAGGRHHQCKECVSTLRKRRQHRQREIDSQNLPTRKTCTKCHVEKPLSKFYVQKTGKYGRDSRCKSCKEERKKASREAGSIDLTLLPPPPKAKSTSVNLPQPPRSTWDQSYQGWPDYLDWVHQIWPTLPEGHEIDQLRFRWWAEHQQSEILRLYHLAKKHDHPDLLPRLAKVDQSKPWTLDNLQVASLA